jgi:hypothetical protein
LLESWSIRASSETARDGRCDVWLTIAESPPQTA